jgi:hypothetical protein
MLWRFEGGRFAVGRKELDVYRSAMVVELECGETDGDDLPCLAHTAFEQTAHEIVHDKVRLVIKVHY